MKRLKYVIDRFVFVIIAVPLLTWLVLKASVSFPDIYFLAIGYLIYSVFVGFIAKRSERAALFLGLYIFLGAFLIPFLVLLSFSLSGIEYPVFPALPSNPPISIGILFISYMILEVVFAHVWCPFRKYTVPTCSGCSMTKVCLRCKKAKDPPCEKCKVVLVGFACIILLLFLTLFETTLIGAS